MLPFSRRFLPMIARLVLALMLFAQFSLAAQACLAPQPAMSFMAGSDSMAGCHERNKITANACLASLTQSDQSADVPLLLASIAGTPGTLLFLVPAFTVEPITTICQLAPLTHIGDAPLSILFCSSQT